MAQATYSYPATLAGCQAFASLFDNTSYTSAGALNDFSSHAGESASCPVSILGGEDYFAGYVDDDTCYWTRKICVTCQYIIVYSTKGRFVSAAPYIRDQTNSMLKGWYYSKHDAPVDTLYFDFSVKFNWDVTEGYINSESDVADVDELDDVICTFTNTG